jgi:hypothetical protein
MSYQSEHKRLKPVLDLARRLDIATNPDPTALFEAGNAGFQVWCTPDDHPKGWEGVEMIAGTFSKPCEYLGSVHWKWEGEQITALEISTTAYALADHKPGEYSRQAELPPGAKRRTIHNRDADIHWLIEKITWLFEKAGLDLPPCEYEPAKFSQIGPHTLARFVASDGDEYLVIVSPDLEPEDFCNPGYVLTDTLELWQAGDFPADLILRPEPADFDDSRIEPDEGPLTEQYENACRLGDDDWLEAAYEDSISGWDE